MKFEGELLEKEVEKILEKIKKFLEKFGDFLIRCSRISGSGELLLGKREYYSQKGEWKVEIAYRLNRIFKI